ncbi:DNA double-stranded break repair helicase and nuclease AddA [Syntrophotalea carbinolica DSM 2380]|uniref:DNA 3'-5' helicase n=1 Tax=Syntrophotalea carbinolica (strain DSM 2380 / NBRC 103641 / GraBd1) TaxID=338963 RepID=Q3A3V6_SYNC1|nr:UvrD-helicase domain-containing protein [Syntrophotalea carbinolica]ABA88951.1 DNA double-stranded break repair helicase and nuclease AddA [Syntrophotalea carbinolica DSM 2380]
MKLRMTQPPDHDARRQALDPARSFIVQAPAGSGKTELLIQRILALLGGVQQPEEVLAITFTRKAAGEMRDRLVRALEAARQPEPQAEHARTTWRLARAVLENDARHDWRLLENPVRLAVQTIDSFCASLVRRMPWLSRFGAQAAIVEDARELYRQAAERVLKLAEGPDNYGEAACLLLSHLDNRMERLCELLVGMLARRDQWLRHIYGQQPEQRRQIFEGGLRCLVEGVLDRLYGLLDPEQKDAMVHLGCFAGSNVQALGIENGIHVLSGLDGFPAASADALPIWRGLAELVLTRSGTVRKRLDKNCGFPPGKQEPAASMKKEMARLLETLAADEGVLELFAEVRSLPPVVYEPDQWQVLEALTTLLPRAVAELWLVFKEQGQCDFVEVALAAGRALGEVDAPTDLLLHLDSRIRHILVDEFQDTSWGQFLLLKKLTAGWQQGDGRSLFLVGDPMQSIYRFREAEVGLYLQARHHGIHQLRLEALYLSTNFRSQAGVVDWVNRVFPELFPPREDEALGSVTYAASVAARDVLDGPAVTCHPMAGRDDRAEALQVVDLVRQARRADPEGTVAVLVRARTHLSQILTAFREAGLPFRAQEIDALADRSVAQDLLALTRALLHPGDRVAWLAVLRAPWCGLSLADLHALCGETPDATLPELLRQPQRLMRMSADGRMRVERCLGVLNQSLSQRGRVSLRMLVEGAWLALGGPGCLDDAGLVDAEALFGLLDQLDYGGDMLPMEGLADKLSKLFAAPDPAADDTLQVMTIHKAKGLEFDTVILPGLGRRPRTEDAPLMRWLELPETGLLLAPLAPLDGQSRDPIYDAIGRVEKQKCDLEIARVLYVAATRAKKRLHLLGYARPSRDGEFRPSGGSFLEKLWPAVGDRFDGLNPELTDSSDAPKTVRQMRLLGSDWVLPALPSTSAQSSMEVLSPSSTAHHSQGTTLMPETEDGRHIGTLVHACLERIANEGLEHWSIGRVEKERPTLCHRLGRMGVAVDRCMQAADRIVEAVSNTLNSDRGRWILGKHEKSACELSLSGVLDGRIIHAEIDRTFVDKEGVRWVVDYKTGDSKGMADDVFFEQQAHIYKGQLELYARLFQALEPGCHVRTALYFPILDGWFTL